MPLREGFRRFRRKNRDQSVEKFLSTPGGNPSLFGERFRAGFSRRRNRGRGFRFLTCADGPVISKAHGCRRLFTRTDLEGYLPFDNFAQRDVFQGKFFERLHESTAALPELLHASGDDVDQDIGVIDDLQGIFQIVVSHRCCSGFCFNSVCTLSRGPDQWYGA